MHVEKEWTLQSTTPAFEWRFWENSRTKRSIVVGCRSAQLGCCSLEHSMVSHNTVSFLLKSASPERLSVLQQSMLCICACLHCLYVKEWGLVFLSADADLGFGNSEVEGLVLFIWHRQELFSVPWTVRKWLFIRQTKTRQRKIQLRNIGDCLQTAPPGCGPNYGLEKSTSFCFIIKLELKKEQQTKKYIYFSFALTQTGDVL